MLHPDTSLRSPQPAPGASSQVACFVGDREHQALIRPPDVAGSMVSGNPLYPVCPKVGTQLNPSKAGVLGWHGQVSPRGPEPQLLVGSDVLCDFGQALTLSELQPSCLVRRGSLQLWLRALLGLLVQGLLAG